MAAIAPWFRLGLPSCGPGFKSQAHHLRFFQFVLLKLYRENNENKQKEAGTGPFFFKKRNWVLGCWVLEATTCHLLYDLTYYWPTYFLNILLSIWTFTFKKPFSHSPLVPLVNCKLTKFYESCTSFHFMWNELLS